MFSTFEQLKRSLSKTRDSLIGKISAVIGKGKIDEEVLEEIEEILIGADVGVKASLKLVEHIRNKAKEQKLTDGEEIINVLKAEIVNILKNNMKNRPTDNNAETVKPEVWLIAGINGVGKTTTIGKLAMKFARDNKKVLIAACDTFRAAAIDQIAIWAERSKVDIIRSREGADPSAVAFDAAKAAIARDVDYLLIDTAGRLHTKSNLMEELKKIKRVTEKALGNIPVKSILIIDGSTGQNALSQVKYFLESVGCDGLIVTKLDGTAKGGMLLAISEELNIPIEYIGVGEKVDDIREFDPSEFAEALFN